MVNTSETLGIDVFVDLYGIFLGTRWAFRNQRINGVIFCAFVRPGKPTYKAIYI